MKFSSSEFIFSNQRRHRIARHVAFWAAWVVFFTLIYSKRPSGPTNGAEFIYIKSYALSFVEAIIFLPDHVMFSYLLIYFLLPRYLFRGKYFQLILGLVGVILLTQATAHFLTNFVAASLRHSWGFPAPSTSFYYSTLAGLRGGLTVGGFAAAIKLMKYWYQKNQDNQLLLRKNLETELKMLKAQVHPHFLFNTLNNLYALTLTNSSQSPEVVLKLSALLNYMLYECNAPKVPLAKEVELLQNYVTLEKIRYENRLDLSVNITGEIHDKLVAPLLLLPFLENSFKHGASTQLDQAWISIDLAVRGNGLKFKLINSKNPSDVPKTPTEGIGLQNVRKRLELIYPEQHELLIMDEEETFMVILTFPVEVRPVSAVPSPEPGPVPAPPTVTLLHP